MKKLLGLVLIIFGLGIGFFGIPSLIGDTSFNDVISMVKAGDEAAVTEKVSEIAELSVLDFKYSNATSITDSRTIEKYKKKVNLKKKKKSIVMTTKGSDDAIEEITVGLPPLKITSNDIDRDSIKYPLEKNNILNNITSEDYANMEEEGKATMAEAVANNGAMDRAKEELKITITGYLAAMYGDDVKITFKDVEA